ncbi:TIGR00266 family protein [Ancylobacter pratisalsi]|uniref:TIGR00266 family protein n=1 Tax=Ancylobacter pratisalsi TaxID=1745854 RepID=A0A6P1YK71_9HYPH|nr:TIGR00266 family protein [Ancylobacter pratisalsi]QIB33797.1 TIGR00266 family protein [Ancylobacter pratisalsi]
MRHKIIGTTMPVLEIGLEAGEKVIGVPDQLSWMSGDISLTTTMAGGGSSGLFGIMSRAVSGGGLFMTEFHAERGPGNVAFAAKLPGNIMATEVGGAGYLVHRHGFICGTPGIEVASAFQQTLGGAVFGGEGFVLQKLSGSGTAWIELGGEIVTYELQPGQVLLVHPGHVGLFEASVAFELTTMRGVKNALFGGDGLFLAKLSGPGKVWLQTLTAPGLAHALSHYLPSRQG